ncbi:PREDICTED: ankyrin repeat domain-containing protein SOWAHB [Galeopterus variegatus]|uniref:Ankyrin repeat domain-containing protein SOWAHB n=1 Tax=Galeopterus variegatus TaxID=482537 RepID=A0ABM0S268_GALVR|nr:PREDICTED: ankyrin repeat domain-containing protein SOWAHB [Galeopterus variegatus]
MARELSQEALLDFLCQSGGRVTNAALLSHFKSFLRDPDAPPNQHQQRRELFKGFVNSVAAVRQDPDGTKYVVLKRRYRDLLGEDGLQRPREPPVPAAAEAGAPAGARCAAMETQGRCCWECLQNSLAGLPGEPLLSALPDPAVAAEKPARAPLAQDDRGVPGQRRDGVTAEPTPVPATPRSPPATVGAAGSRASPPASLPRSTPPGDRLELLTPGSLHLATLKQQQQRTREWVARYPQMPETRDPGPIRAWSVMPDNFLQLTSEPGSAPPQDPPLSFHSLFPAPDESSESWPGNPPLNVFRSIRCQLSLQDLDDFVDQESHGSEESSSGPKESPVGSEEGLQVALGTPDWGKLRNPAGSHSVSPKEGSPSRSPQGLGHRGDGHTSQKVPIVANGLAGHLQETLPWPAPKLRRSLRRSSWTGRAKLSSSDEECLDEDLQKRSRCPPRSRKPSKAGTVPSPRVHAALTPKLADVKAVVAERGRPHSSGVASGEGPASLVPHRLPEHRSSLVPLDTREHEWIVKLASGSWIQVLTLFWEDPQLALHKDFLTGYTALHWIAKHGDLRALQDLVSGAQKAGIALDVNVRSSCGYTPLHLAAIHGHQGVIKLLVQRLASRVNIRDSSGKKPWQYLTSNTSGEIWQLLGAPQGKPIFPVYPLVQSSSPTRKAKSREISRNVTRKTSFAALLKSQHSKWKLANQNERFPTPREREEYSD